MAEQEQAAKEVEQEDDENPNYKPPAPKGLSDIVNADAEDESLKKYKEALLGKSTTEQVIIDKDKNTVIVEKLSLVITDSDKEPMHLDLTQSPEKLKNSSFALKEGCHYKIEITFYVQKEIVTGLRYQHKVFRKGVRVDRMKQMMGSYGPKYEAYVFVTQEEEAPSGMLMRGDYRIKSSFIDDDEVEYAKWEWNLSIQKDW